MTATDSSLKQRLQTLKDEWRDRASLFEQHHCLGVAAAYHGAADELEASAREWDNELLTIAQAAQESGYGEEHLRRQVRDGKLTAERANGNKSRIKVRRGDLPRKPGRRNQNGGSSGLDNQYDPEEDARSIAERLGR